MCQKFQVPTTVGIHVSGQYKLYPQHSRVPIETPRDVSMGVSKNLIEAFKLLHYQETTHLVRHTQALEKLTKKFNDTTDTLPEGTPPQDQTSTNPTQPRALRDTPRKHQRFAQSNTPGIIPAPIQSPITTTSRGEKFTSKGSQPISEGLHPPKQT